MEHGVFTRRGLEQASHPATARFRARRLAARAPADTVLDATCALGADALALAEAGLRVVAADRDPGLARLAAWNTRGAGPGRVDAVVADATRPAARAHWLVADPDRRPGGRRTLDPRQWSPALPELLALARGFGGACLKLAPALDVEPWRGGPGGAASWEWLGAEGELKETVLWLGALAEPDERTVTLLDPSHPPQRFSGSPREVPPLDAAAAARAAVIADPHPALVRSGLLGLLASELGLRPLGPRLGFLGGDGDPRSPFLRAWRVVESEVADGRRVRRMLARHDVGPVAVRKRGHPASAEELARRLRGRGRRRGTLFVARLEQGHRAYLVEQAR